MSQGIPINITTSDFRTAIDEIDKIKEKVSIL